MFFCSLKETIKTPPQRTIFRTPPIRGFLFFQVLSKDNFAVALEVCTVDPEKEVRS